MQLFTTYGVQSSVPAKTVVAVIEGGGSGGTYSFTFSDGTYYAFTTGAITSDGNLHRTNIVDIIGDTISLDNRIKVGRISFWNGETFLGFYSHIGTTFAERLGEIPANGVITPPANATRFAFDGHKNNTMYVYTQTYSTFISLVATYLAPPTTVTFLDEYPNGTQIGDVVNVAAGGDYDLAIVSGATIDAFDASINEVSRYRTGYVEIINDSMVMTYTGTWSFGGIFWYDNSGGSMTHVGWHNLVSYDYRGQILGTIPLADFDKLHNYAPANATHFRITTRNENVITVSYESLGPVTINPPATYKIRQLVFEG